MPSRPRRCSQEEMEGARQAFDGDGHPHESRQRPDGALLHRVQPAPSGAGDAAEIRRDSEEQARRTVSLTLFGRRQPRVEGDAEAGQITWAGPVESQEAGDPAYTTIPPAVARSKSGPATA